MSEHKTHPTNSKNKLLLLSLGALGVVYGDIGTSPLYTINELFFGHGKEFFNQIQVFGAISLVLWAITLVVAFKYVIFVLRADNDGEGGVFALYGLLNRLTIKSKWIMGGLLIFAAGLLFGDGVITPAISVISSVEGLKIATPTFSSYVVPITIAILTALFFIQKKGTSNIGTLFGPIIVLWFACIALLGFNQVIHFPSILKAVNPYYAFYYLTHTNIHTLLLTLGSVMLAVTGGEAMYADMGHFGRRPIRLGWFAVVYPALLLSYLGQGAYILSRQPVYQGNIFYSMVPLWGLLPMVVIATFATIIASQALISGAFSLSTQAMSFGLFPFLKVIHTHHEHEGQIYLPFINWALYVGCVLIVLIFQSSDRLASAYGLAVSGVMVITSISMILIARYYWKWNRVKTIMLFIPLTVIDMVFLTSNSLKLIEGGYIPLLIAFSMLFAMGTWQWGRSKIKQAFDSYARMTVQELIDMKKKSSMYIPRSLIIMTPEPVDTLADKIPVVEQLIVDRNKLISRDLIFLHVHFSRSSHVHTDRYVVKRLFNSETKGTIASVIMNFGYMEEPNVEEMLEGLAHHREINIDEDYNKWNIQIMYERTRIEDNASFMTKFRFAFFKFFQKNAETADHYFELGQKQPLSIEVIPVTIT